jgi:hypothetical protein
MARATFRITDAIQRKNNAGGKLARLFHDLVDRVHVNLGVGRHLLESLACIEHFVNDKLHLAQRGGVVGHFFSYWLFKCCENI